MEKVVGFIDSAPTGDGGVYANSLNPEAFSYIK
jgi:hypothetical protein